MTGRKPYYGIIGNGETCALISPQGGIEWLCLPRFDGKIVYAKALDPQRGEALDFAFFGKTRSLLLQGSEQSYYERTNVLKTRLLLKHFEVLVRDFMPWGQSIIFRLLRIRNISDKKRALELRVHSGIGKSYRDVRDGSIIYENERFALGAGILGETGRKKLKPGGERDITLLLAYGESRDKVEKTLRKARRLDPELEFSRCRRFWTNWTEQGKGISFENEDHENIYYRSLLVIKLLIYRKTGAVLAAPTTSFPAYPGYEENWDYRLAWIRDSYFIIRALLRSGHYTEVKGMLEFLYSLQGEDGHWRYPLYSIDGKKPRKEGIIEELTGPNEEETIRINNKARDQLQLDSEGSVLHATYLYYLYTGDISVPKRYWEGIRKAAQWIRRNYKMEENGIWEFRDRKSFWTYGKVLCYVGLESALAISALFGKSYGSWEKTKNEIKNEIMRRSWSEQRQAFLQTYDNDSPADISVLSIEDYGMLKPADAKIRKTVRFIEEKLVMENGGVKRFEEALLPFYLPTLWLAQHYIRAGNARRAGELVKKAIDGTSDLCLAAEHFDPEYSTQHGNFPQAFCASSFVETLSLIREARKGIWKYRDMLQWRNFIKLGKKRDRPLRPGVSKTPQGLARRGPLRGDGPLGLPELLGLHPEHLLQLR